MKAQVIVEDLRVDGAFPVSSDMYVDIDKDLLKIKLEPLDMELWIRLYDLGYVLGDELHG